MMEQDRQGSADASASAPSGGAPPVAAANASPSASEEQVSVDLVRLALRRVIDPELNLNVVDLGLVYDVRVEGTSVQVDMSLTSPGCPSGAEITADAERQLRTLPGVGDVTVNIVWSPFWTPDRIEPRVRAYLGF